MVSLFSCLKYIIMFDFIEYLLPSIDNIIHALK